MKEKETWICKCCGSKNFYTKAKGPHMGVYCCHCNKWLKWLKGGRGLKSKQTVIDELSPTKAIIETQSLKDELHHYDIENTEAPF